MWLESRKERRDCLDQEWAKVLLELNLAVVPIPNLTRDLEGLLDACDVSGLLLTGGNDLACLEGAVDAAPERDATEFRLLDIAARRGMPVFGVCRGMQLMVVHGGGDLVRVDEHVTCTHSVAAVPNVPMPLASRDRVNSYHGFGVRPEALGADWVACGLAPDGTVEAACHRFRPQWAVMWHPERGDRDQRDLALLDALFLARAA
jgi:putative glutamine amidotransferase